MGLDLEITHADVLRGNRLVVGLSDGRVLVVSLDELLGLDAALLVDVEKSKADVSERPGP